MNPQDWIVKNEKPEARPEPTDKELKSAILYRGLEKVQRSFPHIAGSKLQQLRSEALAEVKKSQATHDAKKVQEDMANLSKKYNCYR